MYVSLYVRNCVSEYTCQTEHEVDLTLPVNCYQNRAMAADKFVKCVTQTAPELPTYNPLKVSIHSS